MDYMTQVVQAGDLSAAVVIARLAIIFVLSGLVGVERQADNQAAGLRTHVLIGLGASLLMMLSMYVPTQLEVGDPGRIAAQVVSGIGFLGGGAILRLGATVRGLTTAASLWATAAVGLAIGAGMYIPALAGTGLILFALRVLDRFERRYIPKRVLKNLQIFVQNGDVKSEDFERVLEEMRIRVRSTSVERSHDSNTHRFKYMIYVPSGADYDKLHDRLVTLGGVYRVILEDL